MKKMFVVMMAFVLGMAITSCKQSSPKAEGAQTEEATENPQEVVKALVEKASAEGANWTADQWKDATKQIVVAMSPALQLMNEVSQMIKSEQPDTAKLNATLNKLEEVGKEIKPIEELMEQFDSIAKTTEIGKAVLEDKEFEKELKKAVGLPEDFDM